MDPVQFDTVNFNMGNTWSTAFNAAVISYPGIYYVHVDLATCYNGGVLFIVKVNGVEKFRAEFLPINGIGMESRGNAALLQLQIGDKVTVSFTNTPNMCLYAEPHNITVFYGMLLSPI